MHIRVTAAGPGSVFCISQHRAGFYRRVWLIIVNIGRFTGVSMHGTFIDIANAALGIPFRTV